MIYDSAHDYLKDLTEDEIKTENGKEFVFLRGLERLAKIRGVIQKTLRVHAVPTSENPIAVVSVQYQFRDGAIWESVADCTVKSAKEGFGKYLTAMAESRAKARALRDAFGISLCSVEEIDKTKSDLFGEEESPPLTDIQKHLISKLMKESNLGIEDVRHALKMPKLNSIDELTKDQAQTLSRKLQGGR